jgi:tyrosyl-tRNA synthetase
MAINTDSKKIEEILSRGVEEVIDKENLKKRMLAGEQLRVKLGIDPTSPNIHLGRASMLLKLKDFQDLGHQVVFIIGDFTGQVGDTSDKQAERPMLSEDKVKENLKTYIEQAAKIIDIDKTEIRYNSEWLAKLDYKDISEQANIFSLAEFIARKNIRERLDKENRISLRELLYPLMQGYDSVAIKADVELGGTDQRFNLLAGREMQQHYGQKPQDILTTNLIAGLDGRKMSSSWGNTVNILDEPKEMFGKIMSLSDNLIIDYFVHCTRIEMEKIKEYEKELKDGKNPRDIKMILAEAITKIYWGQKGANEGKDYFISVFQKKDLPDEMPEIKADGKEIIDVLVESKIAKSKSEAQRLIRQEGIKINQETAK